MEKCSPADARRRRSRSPGRAPTRPTRGFDGMTRPTRFFLALPIGLATMAAPSFARADDSAAAQALFDQGKKAMAALNYAEACPKLEESYRLQEALGTLLNLADCYQRQGKLASAW